MDCESDEERDAVIENVVEEIRVPFSALELGRLRELATAQFATVPEYVRACVLGPRAPGPVEVLAEIIQRRLGPPR